MVVGMGHITFRIHQCRSLKEKRKVVKAIVARIRNHFNASVAEVADNDIYQRAVIGISLVGSDRRLINAKLDKLDIRVLSMRNKANRLEELFLRLVEKGVAA